MAIRNFVEIIFRGISQIFLLNNVITGILFLAGTFYNSWRMGAGTVIGVLVGTVTALLLKYNKNDINQGLYGYNSTLVCLAIFYFFGFTIPSGIAAFLGAVLSVFITNVMRRTGKLPTFTAPFIVSAWVVMAVLLIFHIAPLQTSPLSDTNKLEIIPALSMGVGQVMFFEDVISGTILFIGILVSSRASALYTFLGAAIGVAVACACSFPLSMINMGLFGFNGVLCGIALSGKKWHDGVLAIAAIVVSVFIMFGLSRLGIITLTAPFVVSTWLLLSVRSALRYKTRNAA